MTKMLRSFLGIAALTITAPAFAATDWINYSPSEFAQLQAHHRTIVADVHADWCPTCRAQQPTLDSLRSDPHFRNVAFVKVNFDKDTDFLRRFRIPRQSTIVVFKGTQETARSIAETRPEQLRAAITAGI